MILQGTEVRLTGLYFPGSSFFPLYSTVEVLDYAVSRGALQPQQFCDSLIINVKDFLNVHVAASQLHHKMAFPIFLSCVYLFSHFLRH